jgi:hypothetical protein
LAKKPLFCEEHLLLTPQAYTPLLEEGFFRSPLVNINFIFHWCFQHLLHTPQAYPPLLKEGLLKA